MVAFVQKYISLFRVKLSLKVEYACRVLAQLSKSYGNSKLAHIEELAEAEAVPANYLVQILNELRKGGLINSRRGKQGGYALAREAEKITLFDIIQVMDRDMLDSGPQAVGTSGSGFCAVWGTVSDVFKKEVSKHTLADFTAKEESDMYYI